MQRTQILDLGMSEYDSDNDESTQLVLPDARYGIISESPDRIQIPGYEGLEYDSESRERRDEKDEKIHQSLPPIIIPVEYPVDIECELRDFKLICPTLYVKDGGIIQFEDNRDEPILLQTSRGGLITILCKANGEDVSIYNGRRRQDSVMQISLSDSGDICSLPSGYQSYILWYNDEHHQRISIERRSEGSSSSSNDISESTSEIIIEEELSILPVIRNEASTVDIEGRYTVGNMGSVVYVRLIFYHKGEYYDIPESVQGQGVKYTYTDSDGRFKFKFVTIADISEACIITIPGTFNQAGYGRCYSEGPVHIRHGGKLYGTFDRFCFGYCEINDSTGYYQISLPTLSLRESMVRMLNTVHLARSTSGLTSEVPTINIKYQRFPRESPMYRGDFEIDNKPNNNNTAQPWISWLPNCHSHHYVKACTRAYIKFILWHVSNGQFQLDTDLVEGIGLWYSALFGTVREEVEINDTHSVNYNLHPLRYGYEDATINNFCRVATYLWCLTHKTNHESIYHIPTAITDIDLNISTKVIYQTLTNKRFISNPTFSTLHETIIEDTLPLLNLCEFRESIDLLYDFCTTSLDGMDLNRLRSPQVYDLSINMEERSKRLDKGKEGENDPDEVLVLRWRYDPTDNPPSGFLIYNGSGVPIHKTIDRSELSCVLEEPFDNIYTVTAYNNTGESASPPCVLIGDIN